MKSIFNLKSVGGILIFSGHHFLFFVLPIFFQQVRVGGRNKNKNKIHSDHFRIELKSKETRNRVSFDFNSIRKWSK